MELTEKIESLNRQLIDEYGIDTVTGLSLFRIVWANDQLEKRLVNCLDSGIVLLHPEVWEVKKYPYMTDLYVLERLVVVPEFNKHELPASALSYEPIWSYCDKNRNYLPPIWSATKFVVDTLYAALGKKSLAKYKDSEMNTTEDGRQARIDGLQEELFGDESGLLGKTHPNVGEGIIVPFTYVNKKES